MTYPGLNFALDDTTAMLRDQVSQFAQGRLRLGRRILIGRMRFPGICGRSWVRWGCWG